MGIRDHFYCYEFMVKLNTIGAHDGEVAYWIDGVLKAHFTNLFIRSIDSLKIDFTQLILGASSSPRINKKWLDNVVIARSYIGPISTPTPTPSAATAMVADFNGDGHPDWVVRNAGTRQTAIWYLNSNVFSSGAYGPTLAAGWGLRSVADFNRDTHPDYALFNPVTDRTAIWYLSGPTFIGSAYGPTLPSGWELVATADFNGDSKPDYVLYNARTRQTAIWYLNNNVFVSAAWGPTLPTGWSLVGAADFDRNGHTDYLLFNSTTRQTAIWYLSGATFLLFALQSQYPSNSHLVSEQQRLCQRRLRSYPSDWLEPGRAVAPFWAKYSHFFVIAVCLTGDGACIGRTPRVRSRRSKCGLLMTKYRPLTTSELTRVLVRFDHIASGIVNADHGLM